MIKLNKAMQRVIHFEGELKFKPCDLLTYATV